MAAEGSDRPPERSTLDAVQKGSLQNNRRFRESDDHGQTCDTAAASHTAASPRHDTVAVASSEEMAVKKATFSEWCGVVDRSVAVLYVQHQRKAMVQEELLQAVRERDSARHLANERMQRSVVQHWHALPRAKVVAAIVHMRCIAVRNHFLTWRKAAEARRPTWASQASLSGVHCLSIPLRVPLLLKRCRHFPEPCKTLGDHVCECV